ARLIGVLVIREEEELIPDQRSADVCPIVVLLQLCFRDIPRSVQSRVRVQLVALDRIEALAMETVRSPLRRDLNRHTTLGSGFRGQSSRRDRDFLNRTETDGREDEHARATAAESG